MANIISDLSDALATTVTNASAGIVRVEARRRLPATGIVWSESGTILTAHHVVRKEENITIGLADGQTTTAKLIGRDPSTDLAILQADGDSWTPLVKDDGASLSVGHLVLALGRPGRSVQATLGIVSALGNEWRTRMGGQIERYLQTDVVMYPGFSGGPLVNAKGSLLGLNTSGLSQGVSLAVPTNTLQRVAASLVAHGRVRRGYLGVSTQQAKLPQALRDELDQKAGLLIVSVESDSPAEKGGLTLGDTIVGIADTTVESHEDLISQLSGDRVGTAVSVRIARGGKVHTLHVTVGERSGKSE